MRPLAIRRGITSVRAALPKARFVMSIHDRRRVFEVRERRRGQVRTREYGDHSAHLHEEGVLSSDNGDIAELPTTRSLRAQGWKAASCKGYAGVDRGLSRRDQCICRRK